ncbi:MAG TPA: hypothetical protein VIT43_01940 [Candidatus Dormibacteraeota bacterium]
MATQLEANTAIQDPEPPTKAKFLRIKVVDTTQNGRPAVNINLPIGVVKWG